MHAGDVMTTEVITVKPDATVHAAAKVLSDHGISGMPVIDPGRRVIGILTEGDLLRRAEIGTERRTQRHRLRWFDGSAAQVQDYAKSTSRLVKDVMSRNVISVSELTSLADVATLLETKRIKRVPVLRNGLLVGIVSRASLVRAIAAMGAAPLTDAERTDSNLRTRLIAELYEKKWVHAWPEDIVVKDRVAHLWLSEDRSAEQRQTLRVAAESTPGVQRVEEHLVPAAPPASI